MGVVACSAVQVLLGVHLRCASVVGVHLWCGERNGSISIRDVFTGDKADGLPQLTYRDCTSPHKLIELMYALQRRASAFANIHTLCCVDGSRPFEVSPVSCRIACGLFVPHLSKVALFWQVVSVNVPKFYTDQAEGLHADEYAWCILPVRSPHWQMRSFAVAVIYQRWFGRNHRLQCRSR